MAAKKLELKIIVGSTRPNRFSEKAAKWFAEIAKKRTEFNVEVLDLRDYSMPFYNEPVSPNYKKEPFTHPVVAKWTGKIAEADGFIVVTPEYNHGYPAVLKNAIDYVGPEWRDKSISFIAYGSALGARSVEQLRQVAVELQMVPIKNAVHISAFWTLLDESGQLKPGAFDPYEKSAEEMIQQLIWWGNALKAAREHSAE